MQQAEVLKPRWATPTYKEHRPTSEDMIDGPYSVLSSDELNSIGYQKYRTYVQRGKRIDYEAETVTLHSWLMDPRQVGRTKPILAHGDVLGTIFEIKRSFFPESEEITIDIDCVDERPEGSAFEGVWYDAEGWLHRGGSYSAEIAFRSGARTAGHFTSDQLPLRIDMKRTMDEFMKQVNGENKKRALDFGTPTLIPYRVPKYGAPSIAPSLQS